jgi:hypothetical protein
MTEKRIDEERREKPPRPDEDGPAYERDQGPEDLPAGGSSDPNNTRSHADTGLIDEEDRTEDK